MKRWYVSLLVALAVGCSGDPTGKVHVSGTVTYAGDPIPAGRVYFDPDPKANPAGQQGYADIKNGKFDTSAGGKGTSGGVVTVRIEGFGSPTASGETGPALFAPYELRADLPATTSIQKYDVPASAPKPKVGTAPPA